MLLFTSRYQRFRAGQGAPVRTTVGGARFPLGYELAGHARLITPTWALVKLDHEQAYRELYRARLDGAGVDAIAEELGDIAHNAGTDRLVLLCFCDLSVPPPDAWCHRRMFAEWWQQATGVDVPELAEQPPALLF